MDGWVNSLVLLSSYWDGPLNQTISVYQKRIKTKRGTKGHHCRTPFVGRQNSHRNSAIKFGRPRKLSYFNGKYGAPNLR